VKCTVLQDVYSANGHTLLIRAGAQAFGESRTALMQGQAKIPVLWNEIDDGKVKITLNSPAADALGGSGMDAYVDNHFWLRFGGAMMVSLISDFGQALANKTVGGGTSTVTFSGTSNTADSAAEQALKSTIDIPPTAYTNQGAVTNIFVARHIDMSNVYKVIHNDDR
jgi:type IV secretion system protein VirB10